MNFRLTTLFLFIFINNSYFSQANASFNADIISGCSPLVVNFTNTSTNSISYTWDFGNGTTSILNNPSATFVNPGFYTVKLVANGATSSDSIISIDYIHVLDKPMASLTYNIITNCETDNIIDFTNSSTGATSYIWDFGNGDTSSIISPTYSYSYPGSFPVTLVAYNSIGCSDDKIIGPIIINPTPILNAVVDSSLICDSTYNFTFTGSSSNSSIAKWEWFFGDNIDSISFNSNIQHIYNTTGFFSPSVIATSVNGCVDSMDLNTINIFSKENYLMTSNNLSGCPPLDVNFTISPSNSIQNVIWDFDDGNILSGNSSANNQYLNDGVFYPFATVESSNGCIQDVLFPNSINLSNSPIGTFNMSNFSGCPPIDVQFDVFTSNSNTFYIDFNDGYFDANLNSLTHTYNENGTFKPTLTIIDSNNCRNIINMDTVLSGVSDIDFVASINQGCASLKVDFFSNSNADTYYWDFGDSTYSIEENPEHIYDFEGNYTVSFYANDSTSCIDTLVQEDYILVIKDSVDLITIDTIIACSPYVFNTDVYNIGVNFWNWDFGDGDLDSGSNISHTYTQSGTYNISLFTDAPNGCKYDLNNFAFLQIDNSITDATLNTNCSNGNVNITNNSIGVVQHQWNMGDGTIYTTPNVTHNFTPSQSYVITYEAISDIGCSSFEYFSAVFDCTPPNPIVCQMPLQTPINQICGFRNANMNSPFTTASSWEWDFGDGQISTEKNPSHYYSTVGFFNVIHVAHYSDGTSDTLIINNFINQDDLDPTFLMSKNEFCNYNTYTFNNNSLGATMWEWSLDSTVISTNSFDSLTLQLNDSVSLLNLKITNQYGCESESQQNIFLYHPLALIEQDSFACFGGTINIVCSVKDDPIHTWDMKDGSLLTPDTAIFHGYQQSGWFTPTLLLDNMGCVREIQLDSIQILEPDASFTPLFQNPICRTDSLYFQANSTAYSNYNWSGGVTSSNSDSAWIIMNNSGNQQISLTVSERGCSSSFNSDTILVNQANADFNYSLLNNCVPIDVVFQDSSINPVIWEWNFPNGFSSTAQSPSQQFINFPFDSIQLKITDINGCTDSIRKKIINDFNAKFIASDTILCAGTNITFTPVSEIVNTFQWDFGDGNISYDSVPSHVYQNPGTYNVKLIASDGQGCIDTTILYNYIEVKQVIADFSHVSNGNCPPVVTTFTNLSSGGSNYYWDFGDNLNSSIQNPAHTYSVGGYYDVSLISSDNFGCSDTIEINNLVYIPGPILDFNIDQVFGCDSLSISITNNSSNTTNYLYNFGNGATSASQNPTYTYSNPGSYQITLVGEDSAGCQVALISSEIITVDVSPIINFQISDTNLCIGESFSITNSSVLASSHQWLYGSNTLNTASPINILGLVGINPLKYISGNANSTCYDTSIINIVVNSGPILDFTVDQYFGCDSLTISIIDNSLNTNNYLYNFGDGVTSNSPSPNYTYSNPGSYSINLVGEDSAGCQQTLISLDTIKIDITPIINFQVSDTSLCLNEVFTISNNSLNSSSHQWTYGSFIVNTISPTISAELVGTNPLQYIAGNINSTCFDTSIINIIGHLIPDVSIVDPGVLCSNQGSVNLTCLNNGIYNELSWTGSGIIDISLGTINPLLINDSSIVYLNHDSICSSVDSITIIVDVPTDATVLTNDTNYCENSSIFSPTVVNLGGFWIGQNVDSISGLITNNLQPNSYSYQYVTVNSNNCRDTGSYQIQIIANNDATILNPGIICDNIDAIMLNTLQSGGVWNGPSINSNSGLIDISVLGNGIYEFIYRLIGTCPDEDTLNLEIFDFIQAEINSSSGFCEGLDSIQFSATTSIGYWSGLPYSDSLTGWIISDTLADGIYDVYYTIGGNCPSLDTLSFTILPQPDINISFNQYLPCVGYQLVVDNLSTNLTNEDYAWYINDSLYYQNFNEPYFILDTGFYKIKVIATNQLNCVSELVLQDSLAVYDTTKLTNAEVIRTTIVDNQNTYTEWISSGLILNPLSKHLIYRSENENDFELIATLDSSIKSYLDETVDVISNQYDYIVVNRNVCNINSINSNVGNSILIEFNRLDNFRTRLNWNFYNGWIDNPSRYEIQKLNSSGNWELFESLDNTENEIIINE